MRSRRLWVNRFDVTKTLACGFMVVGLVATQARVTDSFLGSHANGESWPTYGRTHAETHYSPLQDINGSTISRLKLAWSYELDTSERADSQPLEVNGIVYAAVGLSIVHAIDVRTGRLIWR